MFGKSKGERTNAWGPGATHGFQRLESAGPSEQLHHFGIPACRGDTFSELTAGRFPYLQRLEFFFWQALL